MIFRSAFFLFLLAPVIAGCGRAQTVTNNTIGVPTATEAMTDAPATPTATPLATPDPYRLPLQLPGPTVRKVVSNPRVAALKKKNEKYPTFDAYRKIAEMSVQDGNYDEAVRNYRIEASMYRKKGDINAAIVEELKASRYETSIGLFLDRELSASESKPFYTGAVNEPILGCYIGAFIDRDEQLNHTSHDENWQIHRSPEEFTQLVGKPHASYFMYVSYGQKFPRAWVEQCKRANAIPHIAWEPNDLSQVQDNDYLQNWANACARADWPIFIRYASEMNGEWTPYHRNPKLYIEKFRLVHTVLHRAAPRVATIWCVNNPPLNNLMDYYPGDAYCDWVGVNLYSVPFYDNNPQRPATLDSPLALLDPVYKMFASKKPIAICEYAASHMAAADRALRNDFAIDKLSLLYSALPRLYPRVKLIDWFDMDNLRNAQPGRQLNNYNLTEQASIVAAYRDVVGSSYFLSAPQYLSDPRPPLPRPLTANQAVRGIARFSAWVKTYVPRPKMYLKIGSNIVYASNRPGTHIVDIDTRTLPIGRVPLTVYVYDDRNRFITSVSSGVTVLR